MIRAGLRILPCLWLLSGCVIFPELERDKVLTRVGGNPFGQPPPASLASQNLPQAQGDAALKVDHVTRKLLAANPQMKLKPALATVGVAKEEIFHIGANALYVTEGLVRRCQSEGELAALIALELGKMVAEREARQQPSVRNPAPAPIDVAIGNAGQFNASDQTKLVELARYEQEHPRRPTAAALPDPRNLARSYLDKAGYAPADLEAIAPLLDAAERNYSLERQFKAHGPPSGWRP